MSSSGSAPACLPLPRGRFLPLGETRQVMGILNLTPDSFWEGSRVSGPRAAAQAALAMIRAGAGIIDIGGESTRPGSSYLEAEAEIARVEPAIRAIRLAAAEEGLDPVLSVDTRKSAVARAALDAGADMVNDVSALEDDPDLAGLCAERGVPIVLMHKKGIPATMQDAPWYGDCASEVRDYLLAAADRARAAGIPGDRILLDPGIGFGKRLPDNLDLLGRLAELRGHGYPIVVGLSRKSFVGALTGRSVEDRLAGSIAAACAAYLGRGGHFPGARRGGDGGCPEGIRGHPRSAEGGLAAERLHGSPVIIASGEYGGGNASMGWSTVSDTTATFVRPALDILILSFLVYKTWQILVRTQAVQLVKGAIFMAVIYAASFFLKLDTLSWILNILAPGLVIALAIVFQPELRKIFMRIGQGSFFRSGRRPRSTQLESVLNAAEVLASRRRGALIVFSRSVGLKNIIDTGTRLDADISSSLVLSDLRP